MPLYLHVVPHFPHITPFGLEINGDMYTDNCLAKKVVPYIQNLPENKFI